MSDGALSLQGVLADRSAWTTENCPVGRAMDVIGTRSAMLLMREAYYGTTRFDDFAERVGITESVAAARLRELTDVGLLSREPYREPGQRTRHEYRLTEMGRDLAPAVLALFQWGAKYLSPNGRSPLRLGHAGCGAEVHVAAVCSEGHEVSLDGIDVERTRRRTAGTPDGDDYADGRPRDDPSGQ